MAFISPFKKEKGLLSTIFEFKNGAGFTIIEILMVVAVLSILVALSVTAFLFFNKKTDLDNNVQEIINASRIAQNKTIASEGASQYGVYFDNTTLPHKYILFRGPSFALRNSSYDEVHKISRSVEIYEINLTGGKEVGFCRVSGEAIPTGNVKLRLISDPSEAETIYIKNSGQIDLAAPIFPSTTDLIKDSRHVHFDYNRFIDTLNEKLILTFDSTITKEIIIANYLTGGQICWEKDIDIGGEIQKLKIHTHQLNDPILGTQFCIHRDRRYNNKVLTITISGDPTGSPPGELIKYTTTGDETRGSSSFVEEPQRQ